MAVLAVIGFAYVVERFMWVFVALWHSLEAIALSCAISVPLTGVIIAGKYTRAWWKRGHPSPLPAMPDIMAFKRRVRPEEIPTVNPTHVYDITDAKERTYSGMQG